jgi:chromosome segregation ATPase
LDRKEASWTREQLLATRHLLTTADLDQNYMDSLYRPSAQNLQDVRDASEVLLIDERDALHEGAKELETLAQRLDYEIEGLKGKVEDVEVNVGDFERAVIGIEQRIGELEDLGHGKGVLGCVVS